MSLSKVLAGLAALTCGSLGFTAPAAAHPHVYVTVESTVLYDKDKITGVRQRWYFDEFYTTMAIDGLDTNGDGVYDRKELGELAKVNVEGLAEMGYFTSGRANGTALAFDKPTDYFIEHVAVAAPPGPARAMEALPGASAAPVTKADSTETKVLALEFTLPLKPSLPARTDLLEYMVADPQFWIWFDLDPAKGASLGPGAPSGCKLEVGVPKQDAAELQKLGEAFYAQGGQAGVGVAKTVSITCPKP